MAKYATKNGIQFPLLSDKDLAIIKSWGLVNPSKQAVPHPTAIIVDGQGTIRYVRQDIDFKKRPSTEELLSALDAIE